MPDEDVIERQVFRIDDDWTRSDEKEKESVMNQVFGKRETALLKARQALDERYSYGTSHAEVGWLFFFAYENLNAAVNQGRIHGDSISEKLDDLVEEFHEAVKIRNEDGEIVEEYAPYDMLQWSGEADQIRRMPAPMRRVMEANGEKIHQLIGFAYSGTEAVTQGSSEDESPSLEQG